MLHGRRILVTGASSGIGRGLALQYAAHGATVWGVGRNALALNEIAQASPAIRPVTADLTTGPGRRTVATAVDHDGGVIDVVVHAAGALGPPGVSLADFPEDAWRSVLEINLTAVHLLQQHLNRYLEAGDRPAVIALSSAVGREGRAGWGIYAVSKHALEGWVSVLAKEWSGRVYSVNPGGTRTPMRASAMPDEDPTTLPTADDIAPLFLRLAHRDCADATGTLYAARDWMGRNPWEGIGQAPPPEA